MKTKLLFICFYLFVLSNLFGQDQSEWGVLPYDFNIGAYGAIYALSENQIFVAKDEHVYSSTDGGQNWMDFNTGIQENIYDIVFQDQNIGYIVGDNGTLITTNDGGINWYQITLNTTKDLYSIDVTNNGNVWAVGENGVLISSLDNGLTWQENNSFSSEVLNSIVFRNDNEGFIVGNNGLLLHTQDMGQTWQTININNTEDFFSLKVNENAIYFILGDGGYFDQNSKFHVSRHGENIYYTEDFENWNESNNIDSFSMPIYSIDLFDQKVYTFGSDYMLCDCCVVSIASYDFSNNIITDFYSKELTGSQCDHINMVYSDFSIYNEDIAYVLVGDNVMKKGETGSFSFSTENLENALVKIYPNPIQEGFFYVSSENIDTKDLKIDIYNINGKLLKTFSGFDKNQPLSIENFESGIYFSKVTNNGVLTDSMKIIVN